MKRLAELDSKNPNIVKESTTIEECGMMPMPGMGMGGQHTPASINMTADSGSELTGMLRDIMQLAGMQKVGDEHLGVEPELMKLTPEPIAAVGPAIAEPMPSAADDMRSVIDKLHPDDEEGDDLGAFQGDNEVGDDEEETNEGQYDNSPADPEMVRSMAEFLKGCIESVEATAAGEDPDDVRYTIDLPAMQLNLKKLMSGQATERDLHNSLMGYDTEWRETLEEWFREENPKLYNYITGGDDEEETDEGQYDNSPADPNNVPAADADEYAHHENQPGAGQTSNGEKRQSNLPTATFESLMKEYKSFIGESEEEEMDEAEDAEEELEEGTCSTCHKDPCACDDEKVDESTADIIKLAGLK